MADAIDTLARGRDAYARRAWRDAHRWLTEADRTAPLGPLDLELLATTACMLGDDDGWVTALARAHHAHLDADAALPSVRCAFWLGIHFTLRGDTGPATGWLGRAHRLLERDRRDVVERGYLLLPVVIRHDAGGDFDAAYATATEAAEIADRHGDADLLALAVHAQGNALVRQGRIEAGLGLLDEAMVAVTAGELTPIVTGIIYCSVIDGCQEAYALRRARDWTAAMTRWCESQPDMVAFTGRCLVHRAEILELRGAWPDALEEARRARERCRRVANRAAAAQALYRQGELHRLRGEFAEAEDAYRAASRSGCEPQPGLALLRLAQGNAAAAAAAVRRVVGETTDPATRTRLLPAYVEIAMAVGDEQAARRACRELEESAAGHGGGMLRAIVLRARGAIDLADGDAEAALVGLRRAWRLWEELEVPYEAARTRVLVGVACRALGDDDAFALELGAAREVFEQLGAAPELARAQAMLGPAAALDTHGLTPRELQVLRLVAAGATNRAIAAELVLSERTVDRHVSNMLTKLGVSSRTAATAYAYAHRLVPVPG